MDNREKMAPTQPESGRYYTIDELLALMEPQHRADQETTRRCIAGLTCHAAQLAAQGQEEQLPQLRRLCVEMAEFWGLTEDDTPKGFQEMAERYRSEFDSAVSAARSLEQSLELGERAKADILAGLELYAQEMRCNGPELEQWATECDVLAEMLEEQWQMAVTPWQAEGGRSCTIGEPHALVEPQYPNFEETIYGCVTGLMDYAAQLAVQGQEEQISPLYNICMGMDIYWGLSEGHAPKCFQELPWQFPETFDHAVSEAKAADHIPTLTDQAKENILAGLKLYAQDMRNSDPDFEQCVTSCEVLAQTLTEQWQAESAPSQQTMGGIC